jgi:hypothetical protein
VDLQWVAKRPTKYAGSRFQVAHVVHTKPLKLLKDLINLSNPSSVRRTIALTQWLHCWAFSGLRWSTFWFSRPCGTHTAHQLGQSSPSERRQETGGDWVGFWIRPPLLTRDLFKDWRSERPQRTLPLTCISRAGSLQPVGLALVAIQSSSSHRTFDATSAQ